MTEIVLTLEEMELARRIGRERNRRDFAAGLKSQKASPMSDEQTNIVGMMAELAMAKWTGARPDLNTRPRKGSPDLVFEEEGLTADVKWTSATGWGDLIVMPGKAKHGVDVYFLVEGKGPAFHLVGWVWACEVFQTQYLKLIGKGWRYILPRSALHPGLKENL